MTAGDAEVESPGETSCVPNPPSIPPISDRFLRQLPKTDLHVHLDGSLRLTTLIELAAQQGVHLPDTTEEGLRQTVFKSDYDSLGDYLQGFQYTTAVMQTEAALQRIAYELAEDEYSEGVHYFEVRFAPQLHASREQGRSIHAILEWVDAGLRRATDEFNARKEVQTKQVPPYRYGIIVCALRAFSPDTPGYYKELCDANQDKELEVVRQMASSELIRAAVDARDRCGLPVVALDLAHQEAGYPAKLHCEAYHVAHRSFMGKTVHAGEAWGPESISSAVTHLHAERLGHGYHLFTHSLCGERIQRPGDYVDKLVNHVASRRVHIEVCLTSNRQTIPELRRDGLASHPLGQMMREGLSVSLNTDNRLISNTTVTKEWKLAIEHFQLQLEDLESLALEGYKKSFYPGSYAEKKAYVDQVREYCRLLIKHEGSAIAAGP